VRHGPSVVAPDFEKACVRYAAAEAADGGCDIFDSDDDFNQVDLENLE